MQVAGKLLVQQLVARAGEDAPMGIDVDAGRVGPISAWQAVLAATACFDRAIQAGPHTPGSPHAHPCEKQPIPRGGQNLVAPCEGFRTL